ncbi:MAG: hypothetical protein FWD42_02915 [Solirubrobacterales bacterium]|nr:hypothetical protein [Solirubrobacterales bacterium]
MARRTEDEEFEAGMALARELAEVESRVLLLLKPAKARSEIEALDARCADDA